MPDLEERVATLEATVACRDAEITWLKAAVDAAEDRAGEMERRYDRVTLRLRDATEKPGGVPGAA